MRFFLWSLCLILLAGPVVCSAQSSASSNRCGDVDRDGTISMADAQAAFDIFSQVAVPTSYCRECADVDSPGKTDTPYAPSIDPADSQVIGEYAFAIPQCLRCPWQDVTTELVGNIDQTSVIYGTNSNLGVSDHPWFRPLGWPSRFVGVNLANGHIAVSFSVRNPSPQPRALWRASPGTKITIPACTPSNMGYERIQTFVPSSCPREGAWVGAGEIRIRSRQTAAVTETFVGTVSAQVTFKKGLPNCSIKSICMGTPDACAAGAGQVLW